MHLFEYATIRFVPRVERDEFVNVGVILFCSAKSYLRTVYELNETRMRALCSKIDIAEVEERLAAFEKICSGGKAAGPIGEMPRASRFRWLTANRSTIIQTSPVHPGLCELPEETMQSLFAKLVSYT